MKRHERRKAANQNAALTKVIAIHEAGHAVARCLTADLLGFPKENAVDYIKIGLVSRSRTSLDGAVSLATSAITGGPMYSRPMADHLKDNPMPQESGHPVTLQAQVSACRDAGIDVVSWAVGKAMVSMAGSAAEAKFTGQPAVEVLRSYECEGDIRDAVANCTLAGLSSQETAKACGYALEEAAEMFADTQIWRAVVSLADALPRTGKIKGDRVAAIITLALSAPAREAA